MCWHVCICVACVFGQAHTGYWLCKPWSSVCVCVLVCRQRERGKGKDGGMLTCHRGWWGLMIKVSRRLLTFVTQNERMEGYQRQRSRMMPRRKDVTLGWTSLSEREREQSRETRARQGTRVHMWCKNVINAHCHLYIQIFQHLIWGSWYVMHRLGKLSKCVCLFVCVCVCVCVCHFCNHWSVCADVWRTLVIRVSNTHTHTHSHSFSQHRWTSVTPLIPTSVCVNLSSVCSVDHSVILVIFIYTIIVCFHI